MLRWAVRRSFGPVAIRYPRGGNGIYHDSGWNDLAGIPTNAVCTHRKGKDVTILTYGVLVNEAVKAAEILEQHGVSATVLRLLIAAPLPVDEILMNLSENHRVYIVEEIAGNCGIRDQLAALLRKKDPNCCVDGWDLGNRYIPHGSMDKLYDYYGLSGEQIARSVLEGYRSED